MLSNYYKSFGITEKYFLSFENDHFLFREILGISRFPSFCDQCGMSFSNILFIAKKYFQQFCEIYREKTKKSWNLIFWENDLMNKLYGPKFLFFKRINIFVFFLSINIKNTPRKHTKSAPRVLFFMIFRVFPQYKMTEKD